MFGLIIINLSFFMWKSYRAYKKSLSQFFRNWNFKNFFYLSTVNYFHNFFFLYIIADEQLFNIAVLTSRCFKFIVIVIVDIDGFLACGKKLKRVCAEIYSNSHRCLVLGFVIPKKSLENVIYGEVDEVRTLDYFF